MSDNKRIEHLIGMFIVQNGKEHDDCLHRPGFDVHVKMFNENKEFNRVIHRIIDYMKTVLCIDFRDYNKLKGISGANIGIPLNIVAVMHNNIVEVFINPSITKVSRSKITVLSNCGSLNLLEPISVERHTWIQVKWMDIGGKQQEKHFTAHNNDKEVPNIAFTLQHEIDHNKGVLITSLKKLKKGE